MDKKLSIIYAFRNRDVERIQLSMESLHAQKFQNFEVVFVDYGSEVETAAKVQKTLKKFEFARYLYLQASHKLWNKSRALNYGIKNSVTSNIFIADVDLLFSPKATEFLERKISKDSFCLFSMAYLDKQTSQEVSNSKNFDKINFERTGSINGMILASKEAFYKVSGYDEFYHFYGSEDVDLYARLKNAGYHEVITSGIYFFHNWHQSFQSLEQDKLTETPRLSNAMRINEQHYHDSIANGILKPAGQNNWGENFEKETAEILSSPDAVIELENIAASVEHFFNEGIKFYEDKVIEVRISESDYYQTLKYKIKKNLGKQSQTYITLKEVNDLILKKIIFKYRNHNYSFKITPDLKTIIFKIAL
jgi:glycosyltransferase involved in cell wall biosynthesis